MDSFTDNEVASILQEAAKTPVAETDKSKGEVTHEELLEIARQSGISEDSVCKAIDKMVRDRSAINDESAADELADANENKYRHAFRLFAIVLTATLIAVPTSAASQWISGESIYYEAYRRHSELHLLSASEANTREVAAQALSQALPWLKEQTIADDKLPAQEESAILDLDSLKRILSESPNAVLTEAEQTAIDQGVETIDQHYQAKSFKARLILLGSVITHGLSLIALICLPIHLYSYYYKPTN